MATSYENFQNEPTDPEKREEARREAAMMEEAVRDSQPPPYAFGAPVPPPQMMSGATPPPQPSGPMPQIVVLAKPQKQVKPETIQRRRRVAFICGIVELVTALVLLILGIVLIGQDQARSLSFQGFLVPALTLATAVLSLLAGIKGYKGCLIGGLVMAIITAVVSGSCFILSTIMCGIYSTEAEYDHNYGIYGYNHYRMLSIVFGIAILVHLVVIVTCIVQSGFACAELCRCCQTKEPMNGARFAYIAQPGQNGQLVFGGQAMPVLDVGRQNIPPPVMLTHPA